jgi:transmembrane sensor
MSAELTNWDLLARYLSGECSPEDVRTVESWLQENPEHQQSLEHMQRIWSTQETSAAPSDIDRLWADMAQRTGIAESTSVQSVPQMRTGSSKVLRLLTGPLGMKQRIWRIAAVLLLMVVTPALIHRVTRTEIQVPVVPVMQSFEVAPGKQANITLDDGSQITLDAGSVLSYPQKFTGNTREVTLEGAAFFEVTSNPAEPFIVHTGRAAVEVLGTAFNVQAWPTEEHTAVVVTEGRVEFRLADASRPEDSVILHPGAMSRLGPAGAPSSPQQVTVDEYLSWRNQTRTFTSAPLREVLDQVERWYDISITVGDPETAKQRVTYHLNKQPLQDILSSLSLMTNLTYRQQGRTVTLMPAEQ